MKVEKIPVTKEYEVPIIYVIPDVTTNLEMGYYHCVCVYDSLIRMTVSIVRRIRNKWRQTWMRRNVGRETR